MVCHGRRSHDQSVSRLGNPQTGPTLPDWHRSARQGRTGRHPERLVERSRASPTHAPAHPPPAPKIPGLAPQWIDRQDAALAAELASVARIFVSLSSDLSKTPPMTSRSLPLNTSKQADRPQISI